MRKRRVVWDLVAKGYNVAAVELNSAAISIEGERCPGAWFYHLGVDDEPGEVLEDQPNGFDVVVSTEFVDHLYAPRRRPAFAAAVLRPGGRLVISTPC